MAMPLRSSFSKTLVLGYALLCAAAAFAAEPGVVSRKQWQAKPPTRGLTKQVPVAILIHHTATQQQIKTSLEAKLRGLQRFSQNREKLADGRVKPAWPDVPYHYYVSVDGRIGEGRDVNAVGDTNTAYNPKGYIQVAVEGNFETDTLAKPQAQALSELLKSLATTYNIKPSAILAHSDKAQTACPGKNLLAELPNIIAKIKP